MILRVFMQSRGAIANIDPAVVSFFVAHNIMEPLVHSISSCNSLPPAVSGQGNQQRSGPTDTVSRIAHQNTVMWLFDA